MSMWSLLQLVVDVALMLGLGILWYRFKRPAAEDPRLSRGLQLLQSKIAVLEDLSDRTDHQVKTLSHLLDQKAMALQGQMMESENQVRKIEQTMERNLSSFEEIANERVNDKVILERDDTVKYVQAAQMAHSGASVENIQKEIELPREQLELIAKMNKKQLMYDQTQLPSWVTKAGRRMTVEKEESKLFSSAQNLAQKLVDSAASMLETDAQGNAIDPLKDRHFFPVEPDKKLAATPATAQSVQGETKEIRKFVFPRI